MRAIPVAKDLHRRSSVVQFSHKYFAARPFRPLRACAVFALTLAASIATNAATLVGSVPGSFTVTPSGAASYTIPIELPRGSGGLTPSLALVYDSQSGESTAGYGWSLTGLTAITRCPKTIDADGVTQAVQLAASDDYCLGGQRLKLASGTYGGTATYTTDLQDFSLISSYGFSNVSGGPGYFTVQTKDGITYEYGKTNNATIWAQGANSNVVLTWTLDKVSDANGNYYTITYQNNDTTTGDYWPLSIQYTGNTVAGTSPLHTISFTWTPRSDATVQTRFVRGTLVSETQLLSSIAVGYNGTTAYTYTLGYQNDPANSRNQLNSVQECDAGGDCFPATHITWQNGGAGWTGDASTGIQIADAAHAQSAHLVDLNGDGIADLLYPGQTDWMVIFGPLGSSPTVHDTGIPVGNYQWAFATDTNGDGRADLMVPGTDGNWHLYQSTGNTSGAIFTEIPTGLSDSGTDSVTGNPIYAGNAAMADYSGRGLGDLVYSDGANVYVAPNNGAASNPKFSGGQTAGALGNFSDDVIQRQGLFVDMPLDFDGSGRQGRLGFKIVTHTSQCNPADQPGCVPNSTTSYNWSALVPIQSGYGYTNAGTLSCWADTMTPIPMDANGDGLTDLVYACASAEVFNIELSTGAGFTTVSSGVSYSTADPLLADFYGDGRQEAIVSNGSGWSMIRVNYDPPSASFVPVVTSSNSPYPGGYVQGSLRVGSITGTGFDDLLYAVNSGGTYTWHYNLRSVPSSGVTDVVTQISDGLGNVYSPQYALLNNTSSYAQGNSVQYPVQNVKMPLAVVTSYSVSDGIGGSYTETYSYTGAEREVIGLGFLGFSNRNVTDSRSSVTVSDNYNQAFPYIGSLTSETASQSNGVVLSGTTNTYASSPASCTTSAPCFPYLGGSTTTVNDAATGKAVKQVQTQNVFGDGYGDLTGQTVTTTDMTTGQATSGQTFSTQTTTTYADSAGATYCISAPLTVTVTQTNAAGSSLTRETNSNPSSYAFDTSHCRPTGVVVSDSADQQSLTTAFQYDNYGNVSQVTTSGTGLAARTTSTTYVDDGEYPGSISRVVNSSLSLTTTETWNPALGVKTSVTDPNNHTTNTGYDGFGRRISATTPDGVTTSWNYNSCGCIANGVYSISESLTNAGGTQTIPVATTVYDAKGRAIESEKTLLGGAVSLVQTSYDQLGRPIKVSKPYFSSPQLWTDTSYDVLNRPTQVTAPVNGSDTSNSLVTNFSYSNFTATVTRNAPKDPTETTTQTTDALGELIGIVDANGGNTAYTYDAFGDALTTKDADNNVTTLTYDGLGHKVTMTDPDMGHWTYQVDALGEVLCQTDAKNQSIIMGYDGLGRVTSKLATAPGGGCNATTGTASSWTYDQTGALGLPATMSDSNGFQRAYGYDSLDRSANVATTIPGNATPYTVSTNYDSFSRVQTVTYPVSVTPVSASTPVASATATPSTVLENASTNLDGSGSTDPNGLPLQYEWSQTGPVSGQLSAPNGVKTTFSSATPGNYTLRLDVSDADSAGTPASVTVTVQPPTPGTPSVTNPNYAGTVGVSWSNVSGATSYQLYQSTNDTTFTQIQTVNSNPSGTTTASVSGLADGNYYFTVAACGNSVCGAQSPSSAVATVLLPPAAPTGLSISPSGTNTTGNFTLSWNASATATQYRVYQSSGGAYTWVDTLNNATAQAFGLSDGTYTFYVLACNAAGCSGASATISETISPPSPPTGLTFNVSGTSTTGNFTLSWNASATATQYRIYQSSGGAYTWVDTLNNATAQAFGLGNGTYTFYVLACNSAGCSGPSGTASQSVMLPPGAPGTPSANPNAGAPTDAFTLTWGASSGTVSYYIVNGGGNGKQYTGLSASLLMPLRDGTYSYYVQACNTPNGTADCGPASAATTVTVSGSVGGGGCRTCAKTNSSPAPTSSTTTPPKPNSSGPVSFAMPKAIVPREMGISTDAVPLLALATPPVKPAVAGVLATLAGERRALEGDSHKVAPEALLEARTARQAHEQLPSVLPPAPSRDVVAWNASQALRTSQDPSSPTFAPPAYIAYGGARVAPATSTPYQFQVTYQYDPSSGALTAVENAQTGFPYWQASTANGTAAPVDPFGHLLAYTDGNNVSTVMAYDQATGAVTGIGTGIGQSSAVQQLAYTWDGYGNLTQRCDANKGLLETFTYDNLNRLSTSAVMTGGTIGSCGASTPGANIGASYDAVGNIQNLSNSGNTGVGGAYAYDPNHPHAVSTVGNIPGTYTYDANGNMLSGNGRTIVWNADNMPTSISSSSTVNGNNTVTGVSTFSYGPDKQRYYQSATDGAGNTTTTTYIGSLFEVVTTGSTTQYRHNIMAGGGLVAVHTIDQSGNTQTSYIHSDHLGSFDTLTVDNGSVSQQMSFDAFGLRRDPNVWSYDLTNIQIVGLKGITDKGYTAQEELDNVGLVHMNGRVYDPSIGRFISADPMVGGNRYAYLDNNPLNDTDPTGYCGGWDPFCPSSPLNPVTGPINIIKSAGNAAGNVISALVNASISIAEDNFRLAVAGFDIQRDLASDYTHAVRNFNSANIAFAKHWTHESISFAADPAMNIEYSAPFIGNWFNVRMAHSQTLQEIGFYVAQIASDFWGDEINGGYAAYLASLHGNHDDRSLLEIGGRTTVEDWAAGQAEALGLSKLGIPSDTPRFNVYYLGRDFVKHYAWDNRIRLGHILRNHAAEIVDDTNTVLSDLDNLPQPIPDGSD